MNSQNFTKILLDFLDSNILELLFLFVRLLFHKFAVIENFISFHLRIKILGYADTAPGSTHPGDPKEYTHIKPTWRREPSEDIKVDIEGRSYITYALEINLKSPLDTLKAPALPCSHPWSLFYSTASLIEYP